MAKTSNRESVVPLYIGIASAFLSFVIIFLPNLKLVTNTDPTSSLFGWLLTPVVTFTMYGLNVYLKNRALSNPDFRASRHNFEVILKIVAYGSIVLAIFHIWRLATIWSVI